MRRCSQRPVRTRRRSRHHARSVTVGTPCRRGRIPKLNEEDTLSHTLFRVLTVATPALAASGWACAHRASRGRRGRAPESYAFGPFVAPAQYSARTVKTLDGTRLHVREYGPSDAPPIVLIHGWSCSIEVWYAQINRLSADCRVIAYDQRGHGRSEAGGPPFAAGHLADDLAAVLAETVSRPATLVGHSMGGITIMAWAEKYPDQVRNYTNAVLLASTGANVAREHATAVAEQSWLQRAMTKVSMMPLPNPPKRLSRRAFRQAALSESASSDLVSLVQHIVYQCPTRSRVGWARALRTTDVSAGVPALTVPTTFLYGTSDSLVPPPVADRVVAQLREPGYLDSVIALPGIGHGINMEAFEQFNAEIIRLRAIKSDESPQPATAGAD
ncbi:alpha/beta fold hydrolase [Mycobacterium sp. HM-7]